MQFPDKAAFTDALNRTWIIQIDHDALIRIRAATGIKLENLADDECKPLRELERDYVVLTNVLWLLCGHQHKCDEKSFAQGFNHGNVYEAAAIAFERALVDFFPTRQSEILLAMAKKGMQIVKLAAQTAVTELNAIEPEQFLKTLLKRPTKSPEDSESIPAP